MPAKYLAKLAGVSKIPALNKSQLLNINDINIFIDDLIKIIDNNDIIAAWELILLWDYKNE